MTNICTFMYVTCYTDNVNLYIYIYNIELINPCIARITVLGHRVCLLPYYTEALGLHAEVYIGTSCFGMT